VRSDVRGVSFVLGGILSSVLVADLSLQPSSLRLAVVVVVATAIVGLGFHTPRTLLLTMVVWLTVLGFVRRVVTLGGTGTGTDPLLLVAPLALVMLTLVAFRAGAFERLTTLSKFVLALSSLAVLETFNPRQGGLRVGLGGLLLMLVPMLAFWVGRAIVDDRLLRRVFLLYAALAVAAAAYGLWQTFAGLPRWDAKWVASSDFVALNIDGTVRPFSLFASFAEYGFFLSIGIAVWLSFGRSPLRAPLTLAAVSFLGVALVYESARLVVILLVAALGIGFAAHRSVRPAVALVSGALALLAVSLVAGHFGGSTASTQTSTLVAHEAQGLANPLGSTSTGSDHLSLLLQGLRSGLTNPAGSGVGSVGLAASKFGGSSSTTEADPSNVAVALGLPGLIAYLGVAATGLLVLYRTAARRRDPLATAALIVVLATGLEWLNGGQYAVAFLPWLVLGWGDRQDVRVRDSSTSPRGMGEAEVAPQARN
jgi:hypothetical protein